jgi:hypothetical protein
MKRTKVVLAILTVDFGDLDKLGGQWPAGAMKTFMSPDQSIQTWMFGPGIIPSVLLPRRRDPEKSGRGGGGILIKH